MLILFRTIVILMAEYNSGENTMERMMSIKEIAQRWGISERRINELCRNGRIPGAMKEGKCWKIPASAEKPMDQREKRPRNDPSLSVKKLPIPIGVTDYRNVTTNYYYVDKTLMIRDFIDARPQVVLYTRPRRFGKTLTMDMLRTFFELSEEDTSIYFRDKKIWDCGAEYRSYQGRYPVVYITFKDVKCANWEDTRDYIAKLLSIEFDRHKELQSSNRIAERDREYLHRIIKADGNDNDLSMAFLNLTRILYSHYGIAPIIIIDEYDTPIQQGYMHGFYDEVVSFMRNLFSGGLKDNPYLSFGFMTGILRVAKESIFSGLNNLKIYSVVDQDFSEYFGFTYEEVREMAEYYEVPEKLTELCDWYDGYRFGNQEIFNPWSVLSYFSNHCEAQAYWQSTGSNDIIKEILSAASSDMKERLEVLMKGETFVTHVDTDIIYPQIHQNPSSVYSFLLMAGYLKTVHREPFMAGTFMCEVAIPNKEISYVYSREILSQIESLIPASSAVAIQEAIFVGNTEELQRWIGRFLVQTVSYYDTSTEGFYHGLVLGFCAIMDSVYQVRSNRESGNGRFDIQLIPLQTRELPGILIELKSGSGQDETYLIRLSEQALKQIDEKNYDQEMRSQKVSEVIKYGVAFSGKAVKIAMEKTSLVGNS